MEEGLKESDDGKNSDGKDTKTSKESKDKDKDKLSTNSKSKKKFLKHFRDVRLKGVEILFQSTRGFLVVYKRCVMRALQRFWRRVLILGGILTILFWGVGVKVMVYLYNNYRYGKASAKDDIPIKGSGLRNRGKKGDSKGDKREEEDSDQALRNGPNSAGAPTQPQQPPNSLFLTLLRQDMLGRSPRR